MPLWSDHSLPLPRARQEQIDAQFTRVFAGQPKPGDIEELAGPFKCDTVVVTPQDGAWASDPFAASPTVSAWSTARPRGAFTARQKN